MGDAKYGRLFTEADLMAVVRYAMHRVRTGYVDDAGHLVRDLPTSMLAEYESLIGGQVEGNPALTFPADEPLFLLRGRDGIAWPSVEHYAVHCDVNRNVPADHASAAHDASDVFREWQEQHPDRVKAPD